MKDELSFTEGEMEAADARANYWKAQAGRSEEKLRLRDAKIVRLNQAIEELAENSRMMDMYQESEHDILRRHDIDPGFLGV